MIVAEKILEQRVDERRESTALAEDDECANEKKQNENRREPPCFAYYDVVPKFTKE